MRRHLDRVAESNAMNKANSGMGLAMLVMIQLLFLYAVLSMLSEKPAHAETRPVVLHQTFKQRQADALQSVYGVDDSYVEHPSSIWR